MMLTILIFVFLYGLLIGSFLNVLIHRMPKEEDFIFKRSYCISCNKTIFWYENIPIFSFLIQKGKCKGCGALISIKYPLVELACGLFAIYIFPKTINQDSILLFLRDFSVFSIFLVHVFIDLKHRILPNSLNLILGIIFLASVINTHPWQYWVMGMSLGALFPLLVVWIFYLIKGQIGLGGGDIKLFGVLGIFFGPLGVMQIIFLSCFAGALIGGTLILLKKIDKNYPMPFGPFIILIAFIQFYFPNIMEKIISIKYLI